MQVYAATRGQEQLRVYNLRYKDSFEQDKYAASLRREQAIFEELIRAKGRMVLPDLQQARVAFPNGQLLDPFLQLHDSFCWHLQRMCSSTLRSRSYGTWV